MVQIEKVQEFVTGILKSKLPSYLIYHDYFHTQDVVNAAMALAKEEGVTNENDLLLLKTAALFHDCGYVNTYENHEEEGCRIVKDALPGLGFTKEQIGIICNMIMKTKLPSNPDTLLEKILCDADLDYLGRDDFKELGDKLYKEFFGLKKISTPQQWDEMKVRFLQSHHYRTQSAINKRAKKKEENLEALKIKIQS